jgi:translation initiation factor 3 subunit H
MRAFTDKAAFTMEALSKMQLTASHMFERVPISLSSSALANAFLDACLPGTLSHPGKGACAQASAAQAAPLEINSKLLLEQHLESMTDAVDELGQDAWRYSGWQRNVVKEQGRINNTIQRRRLENAAKVAAGELPAWGPADLDPASITAPHLQRLLANEPSRLEALLMDNQIRAYCQQVQDFAGTSLTQLYAAQCLGYADASAAPQ